MRKHFKKVTNQNKIKYFVIFETICKSEGMNLSAVFTIVEKEEIAKDWCERNPKYYYIERTCE